MADQQTPMKAAALTMDACALRWSPVARRLAVFGDAVDASLDALRHVALGGLLLAFAVLCWGRSLEKPLWNDEWFTVHLSRLPTMAALMDALRAGVDSMPPLIYLLTRVAPSTFGDDVLTLRLVSIVGVALMMLGLYVAVRRRLGTTYALAAPVLALLASPGMYAVEARPYGLLLAFGMGAFVCWQSAIAGRGRPLALPGLSACFALGLATHYFMMLMLPPLVAASVIRDWRARAIDRPLWIAFVLGLTPLLALAALIRATAGLSYGTWTPASVWALYDSYKANLLPTFGVLLVSAGGTMVAMRLFGPRRTRREQALLPRGGEAGFSLIEWIAIAGLVATPITAWVLGELITGVLHPRYTQFVVPGFIMACLGVASACSRRNTLAALWTLAIASGTLAFSVGWAAIAVADGVQHTKATLAGTVPEPVVYVHPHAFIEQMSAAPVTDRWRHVYLADPALSLRYLGQDVADINNERLARAMPLQVFRYEDFVRTHPSFLVVWQDVPQGWLQRHLEREPVTLEWLRPLPAGAMLVRVTRHDGAPPTAGQ